MPSCPHIQLGSSIALLGGAQTARAIAPVARHAERFRRRPIGEIIDKTKGKIKQAVGSAIGNSKLEREGKIDEAQGDLKGAVEDVKHAVKDVKHAVKKK